MPETAICFGQTETGAPLLPRKRPLKRPYSRTTRTCYFPMRMIVIETMTGSDADNKAAIDSDGGEPLDRGNPCH